MVFSPLRNIAIANAGISPRATTWRSDFILLFSWRGVRKLEELAHTSECARNSSIRALCEEERR